MPADAVHDRTRIDELTGIGMLDLRGNGKGRMLRNATREILGLIPPLTPNTAALGWEASALWLAPDEWLIRCPLGRLDLVRIGLQTALMGCHHALTDVTHARRVIRLSGPSARDVLAKGCSLDLHPRAFDVDAVAQTLLGKVGIMLHRIKPGAHEPALIFELYAARSTFDYTWAWLADAVAGFPPLTAPASQSSPATSSVA